jgi:hypothetical protein
MKRSHKKLKILVVSLLLVAISILTWFFYPNSSKVMTITDFFSPVEASVRSPIRPFGSGSLFVIYEGNLGSSAKIEVLSNQARDRHTIELKPGHVRGIYGGAEEWVNDLKIRFIPSTASPGNLKIGLYCGSSFSEEDREWYSRLSRK